LSVVANVRTPSLPITSPSSSLYVTQSSR
jgi:hypothetical protein